jgi:hypothetical protein
LYESAKIMNEKRDQLYANRELKNLSGCTFSPKINPKKTFSN